MKKFISIFFILMFTSTLYSGTESQSKLLQTQRAIQTNAGEHQEPSPLPSRDDRVYLDVFTEDFENDAEGWETKDMTNSYNAWHKSDFRSPEEDNLSWWCGDSSDDYGDVFIGYSNKWLQFLDSPVLNLSQAEDGLSLTFNAWWLIEDPRVVPPADPFDGWDGFLLMISTDGGEEFATILPESHEYDRERISAAENMWDFGPVPGWSYMSGEWGDSLVNGVEPEWLDVVFDLSEYAGEEQVVVRYLLVSDRTVSAPRNEYLANSGVMVDNILIEDNEGNVFLSDNADDDPVPAEMIPRRADGFGDWWAIFNENRPGGDGENCMWFEPGHPSVENALISPEIELPEDITIFFKYWVWCDMEDWDGNGDQQLDDWYLFYLSDDDGETWNFLHRDFKRAGAGGDEWEHYVPGTPTGATDNVEMDLTEWAGEIIRLRILTRTDRNDDGGVGSGLYIDDLQIIGDNRLTRDVGMQNLVLPYPLTVGYRVEGLTVEMHNYGLVDQNRVNSGWGWTDVNGENYIPISPPPDVEVDGFANINLSDHRTRVPSWSPTVPGEYSMWARSALGSGTVGDQSDDDQAPENDLVEYESIRVNPEDIFELGYDNRSYRFFENFDANSGPATRFSPGDIELEQYNLGAVKLQFNGLENDADYRLHILGAGDDDDTPGAEIISQDVTVPVQESIPNWHTVLLYEHEELRNLEGDFWVWVEILGDDGLPQIVWDTQTADDGRFFSFNGQNAMAYQGDLMMHAVVVPEVVESPMLKESTDFLDFDEVYLDQSVKRQVRLYGTAFTTVTISNISVDFDVFSLDFPEEVTLDFGEYYVLDVNYSPLDLEAHEATLVIETNAEVVPQIDLWGSGIESAPDDGSRLPFKFDLSEAYPNPFNSMTKINFSLATHGVANVSLFDINGRFVSSLAAGNFQAGSHQIVVNAETLSSGVYLIMLESNQNTAIRKIVLMK